MYRFTAWCLMIFASVFFLIPPASISQSQQEQSHVLWVEDSLREMETIKVGMTRADLLKVFMEEGGLSTRKTRTYAYRKCPYFKVTFEFEPVGDDQAFPENSKDQIIKISQPFLQRVVVD